MLGISGHLLARGFTALVGLALLLLVFGLFVLGTPQGSAWMVETLSSLSAGRVKATGVTGTLLAGLSVDQFEIHAGNTHVVIAPAALRMNWPDLLRRRVHLLAARADSVTIDLGPRLADEPDSPVEALRLPVTISVDWLQIESLSIRTPGDPDGTGQPSIVELGPIALEGSLANGVLRFDRLQAQLYGINLEAAGRFGTGEPFALSSQLRWRIPEAAVSGAGSVSGDLAKLRFGQVVLLPSMVDVSGVLRLLGDEPHIEAAARWNNLERALVEGDPRFLLRSPAGTLQVRGWTDDFSAVLNGSAILGADRVNANNGNGAAGRRADVAVRAQGNLQHLNLQRIEIDGFGGQVRGTGRVQFQDVVSVELQLRGQGINPGFVDPRFKGKLDFNIALAADAAGNFRAEVPEAGGTLFDRPLRLSGVVTGDPRALTIDNLVLTSGVNRLEANGRWGERIAGRFSLDAPDLATLWPGLGGGLKGSGAAAGTVREPRVTLDLTGNNIGYDGLYVQSLRLRGTVDNRDLQVISLEADALRWNEAALGNLSVQLGGVADDHKLNLTLTGGEVALQLQSSGVWRSGVLTEQIESAGIDVKESQPWSLREPATLRIAGANLTLSAHCWTSNGGELCVADTRSDPDGIRTGLALHQFPLGSLSPWLPADLRVDGTASASLSLASTSGRYTGQLQGSLSDAVLSWRTQDDDEVQTTISEFVVNVDLTDTGLKFDATMAESFGLRLTTSGEVAAPFSDTPIIAARIVGGVPDLAALGPMLERFVDIGDVKGQLTVDTTLSGNARQPDISGGVEIEEGAFTVPAAGITVDRIALSLHGREDGRLVVEGQARSGKGFVALDGSLAWQNQLVPTGDATIKGRVIDVIRLPQGVVQVSPDVRVSLRDGQFLVSGVMLVPRAEIKLKKLEESAVEPSDDTVVHGREDIAAERRRPLFMLDNLQVRLGERVSFEGFGLKTRLVGGLRLSQSVGADPKLVNGAGVVTLKDGQFTAFGQKLAIDRGSLLFSGVVTDPGLDVKASREVTYEGREVTVGVLLSGNLSKIITRVFSEPAMGELDALSYLTTGKPLSASSVGDRSAVTNAALSLGLSQAMPVVQQIGSALRVDEIGLGTTDSGDTALIVGEQLGSDLFIRYSYGVFDQLGTIKVTYRLSRRVSLEASSGDEQSLDLIYSVTW